MNPAAFIEMSAMRKAFTLIELLVVVTIIVVLLALLTPALDKAIYQAEMTQCAANMKATSTGVSIYTVDYQRWYPWRQFTDTRSFNLAGQFAGNQPLDTRPRLLPYLSLNKNLQDPFISEPADISIEGSPPSSHTYSSYWLWFGWPLMTGQPAMKKLGDRMQWVDPVDNVTHRFDVMISDGQAIHRTGYWIQAGHQSRESRLASQRLQNGMPITWGPFATFSLWAGDIRPQLTMDCNYLHVDGSATRLDDMTYDAATQRHDERLVAMPERVDDGDANLRNYLPRGN
jgi:prepilin-type N-terminal cleavage/methylation domain-containing protein